MVRINLLPHREQKRQARQRQFVSLAIGLAVLAVAVVGLVHVIIAARIDNQASRNKLLQDEIAKLDEQIKEIDKLRDQTQALLARKQIVETLQANRTRGGAFARPAGAPVAGRVVPEIGEAGRAPR